MQVHRFLFHAVDQYPYRIQTLLVSKQTSCNVFSSGNEQRVLESFLTKETRWVIPKDTKSRVFEFNVNTMKKKLINVLKFRLLRFWYFIYCPVFLMSPAFSLQTNGKQSNHGVLLSPTKSYSLKSVLVMKKCIQTKSLANFGLWCLFPLNIAAISLPNFFPKTCPYQRMHYQILQLPDNYQFLAFFETFQVWNSFVLFVLFLNECVHGFNNVRNGGIMNGLQIVKFCQHWIFLYYHLPHCNILVFCWVCYGEEYFQRPSCTLRNCILSSTNCRENLWYFSLAKFPKTSTNFSRTMNLIFKLNSLL